MQKKFLGLAGAVLGLAVLAVLSGLPAPWAGWARDGCERADCYCEPVTDGFVAQPLAAYSNLGFMAVGLWILTAPRRRSTCPPERSEWGAEPLANREPAAGNLLRAHPVYAGLFAVTALGTGLGSFFYHASLTRLGEWFDLVGLYLFTSGVLVYALARLTRRAAPGRWAAVYAGVNVLGAAQMLWARDWQQIVFGALAAGALAAEALVLIWRRPRIQKRYLAAALLSLAAGAALWVTPCAAQLPFPPHAGWHVLAAAAQAGLFAYYRSEQG